MAAALTGIGFEVITAFDTDYSALRRSIRAFGEQSEGADTALLFYAGHGLQADGQNWLLSVTAQPVKESDLHFEAVGLDLPMRLMKKAGARVNIVLLDACRDNPLVTHGGRSLGAGRGLARVEEDVAGTLIAFATAPGKIAADGKGRNSPFTSALLQHLNSPGLEVRAMLGRVRQTVMESTAH